MNTNLKVILGLVSLYAAACLFCSADKDKEHQIRDLEARVDELEIADLVDNDEDDNDDEEVA